MEFGPRMSSKRRYSQANDLEFNSFYKKSDIEDQYSHQNKNRDLTKLYEMSDRFKTHS